MRVKSDIDHEICFERDPSSDEVSMSQKARPAVLLDTRPRPDVRGTLVLKLHSLVGMIRCIPGGRSNSRELA
jgi:hypothetical protein